MSIHNLYFFYFYIESKGALSRILTYILQATQNTCKMPKDVISFVIWLPLSNIVIHIKSFTKFYFHALHEKEVLCAE
jgi:hypothetical protein